MEALLYFILWAGLIFLMMRFGCGAHVMGHGHGRREEHEPHGSGMPQTGEGGRWMPARTEIDPVCGKTVDTATAKSSVHAGSAYYFCSTEHRADFEADPERYLGGKSETRELEHHHG